MITLSEGGVYLKDGRSIVPEKEAAAQGIFTGPEEAKKGTISWSILEKHNTGSTMQKLRLRFDAMASHDITFVGIIQTAKASGMEKFPMPYVLTNCHNSLCAVGGTINEDDHVFGLSSAKKYGGIYVPPHMAVIHQFMREEMAGCGKMILGSDSHTRYGALGTMAIGEGGGELCKQLLLDTYDVNYPDVIAVYLDGKPRPGVGPQDVALALVAAVFNNGYVKNKVMEFVGPGIKNLTADYRNGIDVMTTETTCLSSVWCTDQETEKFLAAHGRAGDYRELKPADVAYYDGLVYVDLASIKPMIALPFHPSNAFEIDEVIADGGDILRSVEKEAAKLFGDRSLDFSLTSKLINGRLQVEQGIIAGCAGGTYSNLCEAAHILKNASTGHDAFTLSVYPASQPVFMYLIKNGAITDLMAAGANVKTAFCGPCFGAGDTPANNALSIRHSTRNFPNREGSKPGNGQLSAVALMDARSIAATAARGGILTSAEEYADDYVVPDYEYDNSCYRSRVYYGFGAGKPEEKLVYGPNIKDWPEMSELSEHILLKVCSKIMDPVTTTDELIPSGETSSYRSNPLGLAEFTLSRRDPEYVGRAKEIGKAETARRAGNDPVLEDVNLPGLYRQIREITPDAEPEKIEIGSMIYAVKPGDGSAREQAASCQRVLGGLANICTEYATKRYRSNVMNWGMIPFRMAEEPCFEVGDYIYVPDVRSALDREGETIRAYVLGETVREIRLFIDPMVGNEKEIVKAGSLINFNRNRMKEREQR